MKKVSNFIADGQNFNFLNKFKQKAEHDTKKISSLYQTIKQKVNEHVIYKILIINKLKCDKPEIFKNVNLELQLTPDSTKIKCNSKLFDLKEILNKLKTTLGEWDNVILY